MSTDMYMGIKRKLPSQSTEIKVPNSAAFIAAILAASISESVTQGSDVPVE